MHPLLITPYNIKSLYVHYPEYEYLWYIAELRAERPHKEQIWSATNKWETIPHDNGLVTHNTQSGREKREGGTKYSTDLINPYSVSSVPPLCEIQRYTQACRTCSLWRRRVRIYVITHKSHKCSAVCHWFCLDWHDATVFCTINQGIIIL